MSFEAACDDFYSQKKGSSCSDVTGIPAWSDDSFCRSGVDVSVSRDVSLLVKSPSEPPSRMASAVAFMCVAALLNVVSSSLSNAALDATPQGAAGPCLSDLFLLRNLPGALF